MFGDMPSDYCDHNSSSLSVVDGAARCQCGMRGLSVFVECLKEQDKRIKEQNKRIAKLEDFIGHSYSI